MSIWRSGYSDEPFTIRDIQFDNPQVRVLISPAAEPFIQFTFVFWIFPARQGPITRPIGARQPFISARIAAALGQHDKDCPGIAFTFLDDAGKAPLGIGPADQRPYFQVRGEARLGAQPAAA